MINIFSWNCAGGIKGKIDAIRNLIAKSNPDFLFISEAEFDGENVEYIEIEKYSLDIAESLSLGKARLLCYVHETYRNVFKRLKHLEGHRENIIVYGNKDLRIVGIYRGFKNFNIHNKDPLKSIFDCLHGLSKFNGSLIVQGDFNIDPLRDLNTRQGKLLLDWSLEAGLTQLMKKPTRRRIVRKTSGTILEESMIDLAFTNNPNFDSLNFWIEGSDHDFIWSRVFAFGKKRLTTKVSIRDFTGLTHKNMLNNIRIPVEQIKQLPELVMIC